MSVLVCERLDVSKLSFVARQTVEQLLAQLQASEHDKFAAHLSRSRREYRLVCQRAGKGGKQIERCVISTFQAESMGFNSSHAKQSMDNCRCRWHRSIRHLDLLTFRQGWRSGFSHRTGFRAAIQAMTYWACVASLEAMITPSTQPTR